MSCQTRVDEWTTVIRPLVPFEPTAGHGAGLVEPGHGLARSCALTAVAASWPPGSDRKEQTVRQQLRECCYEAEAKRGDQRQALGGEPCLSRCWPGCCSHWRHAAGAGPRCDDPGHAVRGAGDQRGLSRLCDPGGLDGPAGQQARLAPRVGALAARLRAGAARRLDGHRAGRSRAVCPLAVPAIVRSGLASVPAREPGRHLPPDRPGTLPPVAAASCRGRAALAGTGTAFKVGQRSWRAPCWPAGRRATPTPG